MLKKYILHVGATGHTLEIVMESFRNRKTKKYNFIGKNIEQIQVMRDEIHKRRREIVARLKRLPLDVNTDEYRDLMVEYFGLKKDMRIAINFLKKLGYYGKKVNPDLSAFYTTETQDFPAPPEAQAKTEEKEREEEKAKNSETIQKPENSQSPKTPTEIHPIEIPIEHRLV